MRLSTNNRIYNYCILLLLAFTVLSGCSQNSSSIRVISTPPLYWPSNSDKPVIQYLGAFNSAEDLEISRSLWTRLTELFTGTTYSNLIRPMAVVTDQQGVIFVADPGAKGVHRFDQVNQSYNLIQLKGDSPLPSPVALLIDNQSNLIISDSELASLYKVARDETVANKFATEVEFKQPTGLVAGSDNDFYVIDTPQHKIFNLNFNGQLISQFGDRGTADGEFNYPTMIAFDKNQLLVVDSLNFRIQRLDIHGNFISKFGQPGNATGYHSRPKGIATDMKQNIYVIDGLFHSVQIFDSSGNFLMNFGEQGQAEGQFWLPTGILIDDKQTIYIADSYNQRIQMFRFLGTGQ